VKAKKGRDKGHESLIAGCTRRNVHKKGKRQKTIPGTNEDRRDRMETTENLGKTSSLTDKKIKITTKEDGLCLREWVRGKIRSLVSRGNYEQVEGRKDKYTIPEYFIALVQ